MQRLLFGPDDDNGRLPHGTRRRMDGGGDSWAAEHRYAPADGYMQDLDAVYGMVQFTKNASEKLFAEYVPDEWKNRDALVREFGTVALFDVKRSRSAAIDAVDALTTKYYARCARVHAAYQEVAPKLFLVIDEDQHRRHRYIEIDVWTGVIKTELCIAKPDVDGLDEYKALHAWKHWWRATWEELGLTELRNQLIAKVQQDTA